MVKKERKPLVGPRGPRQAEPYPQNSSSLFGATMHHQARRTFALSRYGRRQDIFYIEISHQAFDLSIPSSSELHADLSASMLQGKRQRHPSGAEGYGLDRARYMGGPFAINVVWGMFCADHAQWDHFGAGALMMDERTSGICLGQIGINSGPLFPEQEIGWLVSQRANGGDVHSKMTCPETGFRNHFLRQREGKRCG